VGTGLESSGDGTSWATAYASLEDALDNAADGDEIWMQGGAYPLDTYLNIYDINNVSIYGGFSGTETALSQRDLAANATILDGSAVEKDSDGKQDGHGDRQDRQEKAGPLSKMIR
jgi:hypothetical protein